MKQFIASLSENIYTFATGKVMREVPVMDFFDLIALGYIVCGIILTFVILDAATYRPRMERKFRKERR